MTYEEAQRALAAAKLGMGFVYLMKRTDGFVKIGWAINPMKRLFCLRTGSLENFSVADMFVGTRRIEADLHRLCREQRMRGEWFDDSDGSVTSMFEAVKALANKQPLPADDEAA